MKVFITKNKYLFIFIGVLLIFLIWQIFYNHYNNETMLPSINNTFKAVKSLLSTATTYKLFFNTFKRVVLSILLSFAISFILVFLVINISFLEDVLLPIIALMKSLPLAILIIFLLVVLGNEKSPFLITLLIIIPITYEGILNSMKRIKNNYKDIILLDDSFSSFRTFKNIHIPLLLSSFIDIFLQTFGLGVKAVVMAEVIAQPKDSIGRAIIFAKNDFDMDIVFAYGIIIIFIVIIIDLILKLLQKKTKIY